MEAFNCGASMDYDQEGEWTEILQALSGAPDHSDDPSGTPTCTSMLNVQSSLAMDSLSPNFLPLNPNFPNSSSMGLLSPQSLNIHTPMTNQFLSNQPVNSLEAAILDHLNSAANLNTNIDADSLISTVRQQDESESNARSSWFSTFLQSVQSSHPIVATSGLSSSSSLYNSLLNIGGDDHWGLGTSAANIGGDEQQGFAASAATAQSYSNQPGLDETMEQISNDFINYGAPGSLQKHLSNALSASNFVSMNRAELMKGMEGTGASASISTVTAGRNDWTGATAAQSSMLLFGTPTSSVSSDGGPDDDSSSHEDVKDSIDVTQSLDPFDDLMIQSAPPAGHQRNLNISPLPTSGEAISSQAKSQAESPSPPSTTHDQDKKRGPKSARVTKKPKRERGAKLAIKIRSDVEVLDDGYKWRKYGQKAVKNSPFPRSYYKCTDKQCKVKKHVERQSHEQDFVVVTYEGLHNHSRPDQLQGFNSHSDAGLQHDSFPPFTSTSSTQHLSPMEILGLHPDAGLFQPESQSSHPFQQTIPSTHHTLEAIDQGVLQNLFHGEPRRSSA